MKKYIHERTGWPQYRYDAKALVPTLEAVALRAGELFGRLDALGFADLQEARLDAIAAEITKSSEIEGERLDLEAVRSSVANRLGMERGGVPSGDHAIEGLVEMALDAAQNWDEPLTEQRIFNWQAGLFPAGRNVFGPLRVGAWRDDAKGPMQVVSRAGSREIVHFQAPAAHRLDAEMEAFLGWFEAANEPSQVLKAGIAHLWFETIHPLDDGNGRIGRNILELALARADKRPYRCYSVSAQIQEERNAYYGALQAAQSGDGDYTDWLAWFLACFARALESAVETVSGALFRTRFWQAHREAPLNDRQRRVVSRMLMGMDGRMTNKKYSKMAKCSDATATRDLSDFVAKGIFMSDGAGGRSAGYVLAPLKEASRP